MLYELRGYQTAKYDRTGDRSIILRTRGCDTKRLEQWITNYLEEHNDGKVTVYAIEKIRTYGRAVKRRKVYTQTTSGKIYH